MRKISSDENLEFVPDCDPHSGEFKPRQCDKNFHLCWCVDEFGGEFGGTRHRPIYAIDCSRIQSRFRRQEVLFQPVEVGL